MVGDDGADEMPRELLLPLEVPGQEALQEWLSEKRGTVPFAALAVLVSYVLGTLVVGGDPMAWPLAAMPAVPIAANLAALGAHLVYRRRRVDERLASVPRGLRGAAHFVHEPVGSARLDRVLS